MLLFISTRARHRCTDTYAYTLPINLPDHKFLKEKNNSSLVKIHAMQGWATKFYKMSAGKFVLSLFCLKNNHK